MHVEFDERDVCSKDVSSDAGIVEDMKELTITPKEDDQVKESTPAPSEQEPTPNQRLRSEEDTMQIIQKTLF